MEICIDHYSSSSLSPEARATGARPCSPSITTPQRPAGILAALHAFTTKASAKLILPCLALFFCLPSLRADTFGDFEFTDNGTSITIDGYYGVGGAVAIPYSINGKPVTYIGYDAFAGCSGLTSVSIPASVISMGDYAFGNCNGLTSAIFLGNAPRYYMDRSLVDYHGYNFFDGAAPSFTIYYEWGANGFTTPTWNGYWTEANIPGIIFYQDHYYSGPSTAPLQKGWYTLEQLQQYGFANDWASSVAIPQGWSVMLYEHDNFQGRSWTLNQMDFNSENFPNFGGNDSVSSVQIY